MEKKPTYQSTMIPYPFEHFTLDISTRELVEAVLEAQHRARIAIEREDRSVVRVELFWVVYNFEFRQYIERLSRKHADKQARLDKT